MNVTYLLAHNYRLYNYKKDELIYLAGGKPKFVYFIKTGKVKMVTLNSDGKEFIQSIFTAGQYFGEPALLVNKAYLANTVAMEDTTLFKVSQEDFNSFIKNDPDFALSLIRVLSNRLFYKSMMLEEIANEPAAHRLLTLLDHLFVPLNKGDKLNVTRNQLADMSGLRVETVIRTLKELSAKNMILLNKGKLYKS
jgi:CRP/FNR family cyclic AMP-dependent transcriptional regulator